MDKKKAAFNRILCIAIISLTLIASCGGGGGGGGGGGDGDGGGGGGSVIYVKSDATGKGDGKSWSNAFTDLQAAITAARSGNEIWVAAGTYTPTDDSDRSQAFVMKSGVFLYGGFSGNETTRTQRNWETNKTLLSGDIGTSSNSNDNSYHVVVGANNSTIDGFIIRDGHSNESGAGLYNDSTSPTVNNCTFMYNIADGTRGGGGIYNNNCSPEISDCKFSNNGAEYVGAGIKNDSWGGKGSNPKILRCVFENNSAGDGGSGIYNDDSSPTITECTFTSNRCISAAGRGGAIRSQVGSQPAITQCSFSANSAYEGGALFGNVNIIGNCIFHKNSSTKQGGAISTEDGSTNSTSIINCTLVGNTAGTTGGAIYGSSVITNCILWGNTAPSKPEIDSGSGNPTIKNSCIEGGYSGSGIYQNIIDEDPLFNAGSYTLQFASPCIDAGDNSSLPSGVTVDFAGNPRIVNITVDMGAYEYQR